MKDNFEEQKTLIEENKKLDEMNNKLDWELAKYRSKNNDIQFYVIIAGVILAFVYLVITNF